MRTSIALIAAAAVANAAIVAAAPEGAEPRGEAHFVSMDELSVPIVDGVRAAVTIAEGLVRMGLSTSKVRTYATPRRKTVTGWPIRL